MVESYVDVRMEIRTRKLSPAFPPQWRRWVFIAVSISDVVFDKLRLGEDGKPRLTNTGPQTIGNMRQRSISNRGDPLPQVCEIHVGNKWQSLALSPSFINWRTYMKKLLLSGAVVAFTVTSALAQTTVSSEYYVVRDATTKKCTIVDKKPTTTTTIVDNGIFKTRTEAETGMKTMKVCTEN